MNGKGDSARLSRAPFRLKTFLIITTLLFSVVTSTSRAQITTSITPTSGAGDLNTTITQAGNLYDITGGTRPGGGPNLFHSFGNFSIGSGDIANFLNDTGLPTSNILGRVTDGNISNVFGTIQTTDFGNANLFLMNPAGFLFGPNATVNVGGMVAFTTADYLKLADTTLFTALPSSHDVILTASPVASFGFLGPNAASIAIQGGNLEVQNSQTLSFIGGPGIFISDDIGTPVPSGVTMTAGRLSAPNGLIYMETVLASGEVPLPTLSGNPLGNPVSFPGSENAVIRIQSGEFVMKGASLLTATTGPTIGEPFAIDVEVAGQFTMQTVSILSSSTTGDDRGGSINVRASTVAIDASSIISATSGLGTGGDISVKAVHLDLSDGAQILTRTDGPGRGGDLVVEASDQVTVAGIDPTGTVPGVPSLFGSVPSGLLTVTSATGDGGDVTVMAPRVALTDGGHIGSFGSGDGAGGNLTLNVGSLTVTGGGQVWSSSGLDFTTFAGGAGTGGHITLNATDEIVVSGGDPLATGPSQISSNAFGVGDGGRIDIGSSNHPVPSVHLEDGGTIASTSGISMNGPITIQADTLSISGFLDVFGFPLTGGIVATSSNPSGQGGDISITTHSVTVEQGSIFNAGGGVSLSVDTLDVTGGGRVSVEGAGAIAVTATDSVTVSGEVPGSRSRIESITPGDAPNGGIDITVGKNVSVTDGGRINLEIGDQPGGQIAIDADLITIASEGKIRLDVGNGGGGQVQLTAKTVGMTQGSIQTVTIGDTAAGAINIDTTNLTLTSGSLITSETGEISTSGGQTGAGGFIVITATNSVQLSGGSKITSSSLSAGNAGNIDIDAGSQFTMTDSTVTTEATQSGGGAIKITTDPSGTVLLTNSTISASVLDGTGGGGSVNIDPLFVILVNSHILATAIQGAGGNIFITTNLLLPDANSVISASSQFGQSGTVTIQSPNAPISGQIHPLGKTPLLATSLFNQQCASVAGGQFSSFTVAGRNSLPTEPGSWLTSPLAMAGVEPRLKAEGGKAERLSRLSGLSGVPSVVRAGLVPHQINQTNQIDKIDQTDQSLLSLRQIAPAGFLTQAFSVNEPAGCQS